MPIKGCCDRELPNAVKTLIAYQLPAPIDLRIITPHITDFDIEGKNFSQRVMELRSYKGAKISLLVDRKWITDYQLKNEGQKPEFIEALEDIGVSVLTVRNLHAKILLLTAGKEKALLIGSSNFTQTGMYISHEADIYFLNDNSGVLEDIESYVTKLYMNAQPITE
jgi:HKD family nuclease